MDYEDLNYSKESYPLDKVELVQIVAYPDMLHTVQLARHRIVGEKRDSMIANMVGVDNNRRKASGRSVLDIVQDCRLGSGPGLEIGEADDRDPNRLTLCRFALNFRCHGRGFSNLVYSSEGRPEGKWRLLNPLILPHLKRK